MPAREYPSLAECLAAARYWRFAQWSSGRTDDEVRCRRLREEWVARALRARRWLRGG